MRRSPALLEPVLLRGNDTPDRCGRLLGVEVAGVDDVALEPFEPRERAVHPGDRVGIRQHVVATRPRARQRGVQVGPEDHVRQRDVVAFAALGPVVGLGRPRATIRPRPSRAITEISGTRANWKLSGTSPSANRLFSPLTLR